MGGNWTGRMIRLPDKVRIAQISKPLRWLRLDGDIELESVVEPPFVYPGVVFKDWPEQEIDVTGYEWSAWTWLGWTVVFMWAEE